MTGFRQSRGIPKPYYRELYTFVREEYSRTVVYPPAEDIFNAFHFTPLSEVKVLLLGQDPITNVNQAHGLSFSVLAGAKGNPALPCRTFIRNCMMIWAVTFRITVI